MTDTRWNVYVTGKLLNAKGEFKGWSRPRLWASFVLQMDAINFANQTVLVQSSWQAQVVHRGSKPSFSKEGL